MAATKLGIYNKALGHLGERKLASLSEAREPRRVLDDYYSDVVQHCLEMGKWTFAIRKGEIGAHPTPGISESRAMSSSSPSARRMRKPNG